MMAIPGTFMDGSTTLAFIGDMMLGRHVSGAFDKRPPEHFWGGTLDTLRATDAVFANLECPIAEGPLPRNAWKTFHFRADPRAVNVLTAGNVRGVCLANNHMMDFGAGGVEQTLRRLDEAGIAHAGAGMDRDGAEAGALVETRDLTVGFIAATDNVREFGATANRPGTNFITTIRNRARTLDWIARTAESLRRRGADIVVLALHWGPNMRTKPPVWFQTFARRAIDAGVDLIHGHSAHVFQAVERYRDGVILYDTGNFIDDYWKFPFRRTFWTFIFMLDVKADRSWNLRLVPVVHRSPVQIADGAEFYAICERMKMLSRPFGTPMHKIAEGLSVPGALLRPRVSLAA